MDHWITPRTFREVKLEVNLVFRIHQILSCIFEKFVNRFQKVISPVEEYETDVKNVWSKKIRRQYCEKIYTKNGYKNRIKIQQFYWKIELQVLVLLFLWNLSYGEKTEKNLLGIFLTYSDLLNSIMSFPNLETRLEK